MTSHNAQVAVVGGGLVGLATAYALARRGLRVVVVEKETDWAQHQSGHNSGVVHSGVYYPAGSLKLQLALAGGAALERFCQEHGVAFRRTGKAIVATRDSELRGLAALKKRAEGNGVDVRDLPLRELAEREPHVRGLAALWVPSTGVVDFPGVARALARALEELGAELFLGSQVIGLSSRGDKAQLLVHSDERTWAISAQQAVVCAGLQADRLLRATDSSEADGSRYDDVRIAPFRGEYAELTPEASHLVNGLVYPVPDPTLPFLGVHLTRGIDGQVHVGPSAVPALSREGYRWRDVNLDDLREAVSYSGSWRLARRHLGYGVGEVARSLVKPAFVRSVQRLLPGVTAADLRPSEAGVRAQALRPDGSLVEDFELRRRGAVLHVINAPSPAATASLAIGEHIASEL